MRPHLYSDLADWWHLLSTPEDYEEEAGLYVAAIRSVEPRPLRTMLELGSGGGNNASHMKKHFEMTLCDLSPEMLAQSKKINPELEHIEGDMRTVRLDRTFDAVFIQDAIMYMTTEDDLRAAIVTAAEHLAQGGVVLIAPDDFVETYELETSHGGHDGDDGRSIRYLQWDRPLEGTSRETTMVYVMRDGDREWTEIDRHHWGLFTRDTWLRLLSEAGFDPVTKPYEHSDFEPDKGRELVLGVKRA